MNSNVMNLGQRRDDNPEDVYDRIRQEIEGVDCGEYDLTADEIYAICNSYHKDLFMVCISMYKYGYANGVNSMSV